jgi:serine/threonine protein phosphatase PrpC
MSSFYGKRTFSNYHYSHNQLSRDNPFRAMGTTYNPYLPKASNQNNYDKQDYNQKTSNPLERSANFEGNNNTSKSPINTYKIVNNEAYNKNIRHKYSLYPQNRDHVAELFNYTNKDNSEYYSGNTNNMNSNQLKYSTYTTPKAKYERNKERGYKKEIISDNNLSEYYEDNCNLIKNFAYKEEPNNKFRGYMEDKGVSIININGDPDKALFCLFDGHGGDKVSNFLQSNFIQYFKEILPLDNAKEKLTSLFKKLDEKIKELNCYQVGAAACIIYITKEKGQKCLYSANVGDTRSLLISNNDYKRLSYDHRASDDNEYKRIVNDGGIVFAGRVYGSLMLGRAFGDWELKSYGVTCEPSVTRINITNNDKYVIIATDGVWDVCEESDIFDLSKKINNSKELCNTIVDKSVIKGSTDNISCFVITL